MNKDETIKAFVQKAERSLCGKRTVFKETL